MLTVLVPMAGDGSRFADTGRFSRPKPYLELEPGFTMFLGSTVSLPKDAHYIFIVRSDQYIEESYRHYFESNYLKYSLIIQDGKLDGAVATSLLAANLIDSEDPLLIVDSDQYSIFDPEVFFETVKSSNALGGVLTFAASSPDYSYVKSNNAGMLSEIAEKQLISEDACAGLYFWSKGSDYIKYARLLLARATKINSEYYVSQVYKTAMEDGCRFISLPVNKHYALGTPSGYDRFTSARSQMQFTGIHVDRSSTEFRATDIDVDNYITKLENFSMLNRVEMPTEVVRGKTYLCPYNPAFWHFMQDHLAQYEVLKARIPDLNIVFIEYAPVLKFEDGACLVDDRFTYVPDLSEIYLSPEAFERTFVHLDPYIAGSSNVLFEEIYFYNDVGRFIDPRAWHEYGIHPRWESENNEAWVGIKWAGTMGGRDSWRKEGVNLMRKRLHAYAIKDNDLYPELLYLSRRDANERHSGIISDPEARLSSVQESSQRDYDEKKIEDYFVSKGYVAVCMEGLPYKKQINFFYNAKRVASLTGSGLSNLICANPGTVLIEMHVKSNFDFSYEYLTEYLDQTFIFTELRSVDDSSGLKIELEWDKIKEKLDNYKQHIIGELP